MNSFKVIIASLAGIAGVAAVGVTVSLMTRDTPSQEQQPNAKVMADRSAPSARNNPMVPVVQEEASRRSTLHNRLADDMAKASETGGGTYVAPPVITEVRSSTENDALTRAIFEDQPQPQKDPEPEVKAPEPEPVEVAEPAPEPAADHWNYYDAYKDRLRVRIEPHDPQFRVIKMERQSFLGAIWDAVGSAFIGTAHAGGYVEPIMEAPVRQQVYQPEGPYVIYSEELYGPPLRHERSSARPELVGYDELGRAFGTQAYHDRRVVDNGQGRQVLARAGDLVYARLMYGFNSDDIRGIPIYAIVTDTLESGEYGPLHNARIEGRVAYSDRQASISFNRILLADGRDIPMAGIAISADAARTGVAKRVNRHTLQNYGALFLSGLMEGFGRVLDYRLTDGDTTIINTGDGTVTTSRNSDDLTDKEILAGALGPVGRNFSRQIERAGSRPPTMTAPAGHIFGVVFVDTLVFDPATMKGDPAYNPRTGGYSDVTFTPNQQPQTISGQQPVDPVNQVQQSPTDGWTVDPWMSTQQQSRNVHQPPTSVTQRQNGQGQQVPSAIMEGVGQ